MIVATVAVTENGLPKPRNGIIIIVVAVMENGLPKPQTQMDGDEVGLVGHEEEKIPDATQFEAQTFERML